MRFVYHPDAKAPVLEIVGESYTHIFKARRHDKRTPLTLCNLTDSHLYTYHIASLDRHKARLELIDSAPCAEQSERAVHIIWAVVDPKVIEKTLPMLNELGVSKLTLFFSQYSQRTFRPNLARLHKILTHSCEQCGRSTLLEIEVLEDLDSVLGRYEDCVALEFGGAVLECANLAHHLAGKSLIIGAEGGFSPSERARMPHIVSIAGGLILRSESACVFATSVLKLL